MTVSTDRPITDERVVPSPARLSLPPTGSLPGLLDGARRPRSRDPLREPPAPADVLYTARARVTVDPTRRAVAPPEEDREAALPSSARVG